MTKIFFYSHFFMQKNLYFAKTQIWKKFVIIVYIATLFLLQFFYWKRSFRYQHPYAYVLVLQTPYLIQKSRYFNVDLVAMDYYIFVIYFREESSIQKKIFVKENFLFTQITEISRIYLIRNCFKSSVYLIRYE